MGQRAGHTTSPLYGTNFLILLFIMVPRLQHQQSYALMLVYQPQVAVTFGLGVVQVVAMQQRCVKFSWQNARDVPGFPGNVYAVFKHFLVSGVQCPDGFEAFTFALGGMLVQTVSNLFFGGVFSTFVPLSARCGKVTKISEVTGSPQQSQIKDYEALSAIKLQSIFCPEPPGDSVTRKSLLDSIVLGCIPIIFVHQELDMFEAFVTAEEFAEAVLYVPEAEILGSEGKISLWGTGTFHEMSKTWRRFKKLYPRSAPVFDALAPHHTKEQRETRIRELFPKNRSMLDILTSMSEEEIQEKQRALAKISHRFVIGLDDSSEDSVRILLNRIASNDALVAQRNRESTLSF